MPQPEKRGSIVRKERLTFGRAVWPARGPSRSPWLIARAQRWTADEHQMRVLLLSIRQRHTHFFHPAAAADAAPPRHFIIVSRVLRRGELCPFTLHPALAVATFVRDGRERGAHQLPACVCSLFRSVNSTGARGAKGVCYCSHWHSLALCSAADKAKLRQFQLIPTTQSGVRLPLDWFILASAHAAI